MLGISPFVLREYILFWPYNKSFTDPQACLVKMAKYDAFLTSLNLNFDVPSANTKIKREETVESGGGFLFSAPPTFRVPFSFAYSPLSESLEQAMLPYTE